MIYFKYYCFYHPVFPVEYEVSNNVNSESGSNETGYCSSLADSGRLCNAPLTSVLFDGIPTLPGLDGDMWARQLLTFDTSASDATIRFNFTTATDNNGITTYTGVETIEVVMFNCPMRGIGASNIAILADGSLIDTIPLNDISTSCDYLVRVCVDGTLATTSQIITLNFNNNMYPRLYVAEISFYSNVNRQCSPVGPITTSVITTTTSIITTTTSGNLNWFCCWVSEASPNWSVQSRFHVIYIYVWETHTKTSYAKMRGRNYVLQTCACSKSVLGV